MSPLQRPFFAVMTNLHEGERFTDLLRPLLLWGGLLALAIWGAAPSAARPRVPPLRAQPVAMWNTLLSSPGDPWTQAASAPIRIDGALSIAAWVAGGRAIGAQHVVSQGEDFLLARHGDGFRFTVNLVERGPVTVSATAAQDRWSHVVAVFDGERLRLYVDGALLSETAAAGHLATGGGPLRIAAQPAWSATPLFVDRLRIYDVAIDAMDIINLLQGEETCLAARAPNGLNAVARSKAGEANRRAHPQR